ncbi:Zn-dependent hydrolase [Treponema sp. JC4]|jgi:glyoxylase-like metal-dependent hydrolase (beta-lactamase superfamily II)|uniref:MBL fold metallo-hydrolase n=1 Tax=Treponema sp. JC4 TaxID=1124982 RepID=UPI00025B072A|nr:MBL fold metallo-hydrolase [Treponema sp. JC4]EID85245.1 Zn-dependent hydrolase [Treponema sp. JC4]
MKVYYHHNPGGFSNCYIVVNEAVKEAIIIDPGKVTDEIISQIEENGLSISGILITHNHGSHVHGLKTLQKIYSPKIYAADWEVAGDDTTVLSNDGHVKIAKLNVQYMTVPGHTSDSMVYKIENVLFTGDVLGAGSIGSTNSSYSKFILESNIKNKIYTMDDQTVIMPGHGPLSTLGALKNVMDEF